MARVSLPDHMRETSTLPDEDVSSAGPFVTISREYGCYGFSLGLLLLDILNEELLDGVSWKVYQREILTRLANETDTAADMLERQRLTKPKLVMDFFRSIGTRRRPSGFEIRNRISTIIRGLAIDGHALIIGQGGAGAVTGLPNGITVRLEAPEEWRVKQIAFREELTETQARMQIRDKERDRKYLHKIYQTRFPKTPAFNLVYDCSQFTLAQIAQQIVYALKLKGCIPKR